MNDAVLRVEDLHVEIHQAARDADLARRRARRRTGRIHALVGESGGGKSMLAKAATGLLRPAP